MNAATYNMRQAVVMLFSTNDSAPKFLECFLAKVPRNTSACFLFLPYPASFFFLPVEGSTRRPVSATAKNQYNISLNTHTYEISLARILQ